MDREWDSIPQFSRDDHVADPILFIELLFRHAVPSRWYFGCLQMYARDAWEGAGVLDTPSCAARLHPPKSGADLPGGARDLQMRRRGHMLPIMPIRRLGERARRVHIASTERTVNLRLWAQLELGLCAGGEFSVSATFRRV